jgi:N6-adenosine-specific RNA methylase IME4
VQASDPELFERIKQGRVPVSRAARQVRQRQRDAALAQEPPLPDGHFDVAYADPPWRLPGSADSSRSIENHYPTLPLDEIKALEIPASEDAAVFLWAVNSLLPEALEVMAAWGFTYKNNFAWVKDKIGLGVWNRTQHELLLLGIRGNFRPAAEHLRPSSVIQHPRGRHSEKPVAAYELIERAYPHTRKLELYARGLPRPGWTAWGNQTEPAGEEA